MISRDVAGGPFLTPALRWSIIVVAWVVFPLLLFFSHEAKRTASNRVIEWLPTGLVETQQFFDFLLDFHEGELLMVSWDAATAQTPELDAVADALLAPPAPNEEPYFERVLTSRTLHEELTAPPLDLTDTEARRRLSGWMLGKDGERGCLVAIISVNGTAHRKESIAHVYSSVQRLTGLRDDQIQVAGPSIDSVAIDEITATSQAKLLPIFLVSCLALLFLALRSVLASAIVFCVAAMNAELGPALIFVCGGHMDSISLLIGSLVYVLTISAGVHLVNYYHDARREGDAVTAPWATLRKAFVPCSLATLTTVLGLLSLVASQMIPIRSFGLFASLALVIGTCGLFVVFPAVVQQFPLRSRTRGTRELNRATAFWHRVAGVVHRHRRAIVGLTLLAILAAAAGLPRLNTSVTFHGMFDPHHRVIRDYNTLEEAIGGLIPIEVVLAVPRSVDGTTLLEELWLLQAAVGRLSRIHGVDTAISALNFAPSLPPRDATTTRSSIRRTMIQSILPHHLDQFESIGFLQRRTVRPDHRIADEATVDAGNGVALWRISLRIPAREQIKYDTLLASIRDTLTDLAAQSGDFGFARIGTLVTGGVPLVYKAQQQLLDDLIQSFLMAFGTIALAMMILLRGVVRGLVSMIPNVFPCLVIFGAMAWWGRPVDMGSMMTASVAMGIAVDGTLHFITWFDAGMRRGLVRRDAVVYAYEQCATALTQTTVICGVGMLVFCWSSFLPIAQFASMLCWLLFAALVGDLVVLPAILSGRWGKVFETPNPPVY